MRYRVPDAVYPAFSSLVRADADETAALALADMVSQISYISTVMKGAVSRLTTYSHVPKSPLIPTLYLSIHVPNIALGRNDHQILLRPLCVHGKPSPLILMLELSADTTLLV